MQKAYKPKLVDILTTYRATLPVVEVSHGFNFQNYFYIVWLISFWQIMIMLYFCSWKDFGDRDVAVFAEEVTKFSNEQKNLNLHLQNFRKTLKNIVPIKEQERLYY